MQKIILVGLGNMGQALLKGMVKVQKDHVDITVIGHLGSCNKEKKELCESLGVTFVEDPQNIQDADIVMFCVKPQVMKNVVPLYSHLERALFVSVAAGLEISAYQEWLGGQKSIVRAMPNTPSLVGCGMSALVASDQVSEAQKRDVSRLFESVGEVAWLKNETDMHIVTAISGSGPAYFFLMMEAMLEAGVQRGLPQDLAEKLVIQTALGAAQLSNCSVMEQSLPQLREKVTSPGGVTEVGVGVLLNKGFKDLMNDVISAATHKSLEISEVLKP